MKYGTLSVELPSRIRRDGKVRAVGLEQTIKHNLKECSHSFHILKKHLLAPLQYDAEDLKVGQSKKEKVVQYGHGN